MQKLDCILIGKTIKPHGIHGELVIECGKSDGLKNIKESIFLDVEGLLVPFFIDTLSQTSPHRYRIKFLWINKEEYTGELINCEIYIPSEQLESDEKIIQSPEFLIDFNVIDKTHGNIGTVQQYINNPSNPILLVKNNPKEILIPYHEDLIDRIRLKKREIYIDAPDGLIDLYLNDDDHYVF